MVFHWSPSVSKFLQVSGTLLSILADLNKTVVWMILILHMITNSFNPFFDPLGAVSTPLGAVSSVLLQFVSPSHSCSTVFFGSLARSEYFSVFCWILISTRVCPPAVNSFSWFMNLLDILYIVVVVVVILLAILTHRRFLMVFHWNLSDSMSTTISRTLFSILTDVNNAVAWTVSIRPPVTNCPGGCGCRIHRHHLSRAESPPPQPVSKIWHYTIWWWGSSNAGVLGNAKYFIAIAPSSTLAWSCNTW